MTVWQSRVPYLVGGRGSRRAALSMCVDLNARLGRSLALPKTTSYGYCLMLAITLLSGCRESGSSSPPVLQSVESPSATTESKSSIRFRERLPDPQSPFAYRSGEDASYSTIVAGMGGGVAIFDFDRDDRLDMLFPGGGQIGQRQLHPLPAELYRNHGDWMFRSCADRAGLNQPAHYSHGTAVGDFDHDGFEDVLITGYGGVELLHNQGDGTFQERTAGSQLTDMLWSTSAAWGDLNGDGHLDLYIVHYVDWSFDNDPLCPTVDGKLRERCPPQSYGPLPDTIYLSQGDGTFVDASAECGLRRDGKGLGVVMADLDLDGDLDIYVANDTVGNFLYRNNGQGHFEEIAVAAGCAFNETGTPDGSMGVTVCDYDLDGLPDLWTVNYERETIALYKNLGDCNFEHVSQRTGVSTVGTVYVGFGTVFFDADLDGDEDAFVANGHVLRYPNNAPVRQRPLMFENLAGKRFVDVASQSSDYSRDAHVGRGVAHGDFDGDGDLDLAVSHLDDPAVLLENTSESSGQWLKVRLIGTTSNRDAIGARATLKTSGGSQLRLVSSGDSYLSHSDRSLNWGIPQGAVIEQLSIEWPSGRSQTVKQPVANQTLILHEPQE